MGYVSSGGCKTTYCAELCSKDPWAIYTMLYHVKFPHLMKEMIFCFIINQSESTLLRSSLLQRNYGVQGRKGSRNGLCPPDSRCPISHSKTTTSMDGDALQKESHFLAWRRKNEWPMSMTPRKNSFDTMLARWRSAVF